MDLTQASWQIKERGLLSKKILHTPHECASAHLLSLSLSVSSGLHPFSCFHLSLSFGTCVHLILLSSLYEINAPRHTHTPQNASTKEVTVATNPPPCVCQESAAYSYTTNMKHNTT